MGFSAIAFSGGWESTYCLLFAIEKHGAANVQPVFFAYGQPYLEEETKAIRLIAETLGVLVTQWEVPQLPSEKGIFENRNEVFMRRISYLAPDRIYFGSRNPFSAFDHYGDSNSQWARSLSLEIGVPILTPCTWLPKWWIKWQVTKKIPATMVYSTEGKS